jgi:hypothetical protein
MFASEIGAANRGGSAYGGFSEAGCLGRCATPIGFGGEQKSSAQLTALR